MQYTNSTFWARQRSELRPFMVMWEAKIKCMYVCMYACMYVCIYVCMHACMHACIHTCMHTYVQPKVGGPEVKVEDTTVSIEQQARTKIKAVL